MAGDVNQTQFDTKLLPHLKEQYVCSVTGLAENEYQEVYKLSHNICDIFSTSCHDLGCTEIVKHHIHAGEAAYTRQQLSSPPLLYCTSMHLHARHIATVHVQNVNLEIFVF